MSEQAEERFHQALNRLLEGKPIRVKAIGQITLNKINNEAGYGRSYIHKFKTFIADVAEPAINKHNRRLELLSTKEVTQNSPATMTPTIEDKLRAERNREEKLKKDYKAEVDALRTKVKMLEAINNTLMYRLYELQNQHQTTITDIIRER